MSIRKQEYFYFYIFNYVCKFGHNKDYKSIKESISPFLMLLKNFKGPEYSLKILIYIPYFQKGKKKWSIEEDLLETVDKSQ